MFASSVEVFPSIKPSDSVNEKDEGSESQIMGTIERSQSPRGGPSAALWPLDKQWKGTSGRGGGTLQTRILSRMADGMLLVPVGDDENARINVVVDARTLR